MSKETGRTVLLKFTVFSRRGTSLAITLVIYLRRIISYFGSRCIVSFSSFRSNGCKLDFGPRFPLEIFTRGFREFKNASREASHEINFRKRAFESRSPRYVVMRARASFQIDAILGNPQVRLRARSSINLCVEIFI